MSVKLPDERRDDLLFWSRWRIEKIPPDEFLEIHGDEELQAAKRYSSFWGGDHFNPGVGRYVPGRLEQHCFYIGASDILRHEYEVAHMKITVFETAAEILTRVDIDLGAPAGYLMAVHGLAKTLFRAGDAPFYLLGWKAKDELARFSTDPVQLMGAMPGWNTIGGGITEGRVYFLIEKTADPRRGQLAPPPVDNWLRSPLLDSWRARSGRP